MKFLPLLISISTTKMRNDLVFSDNVIEIQLITVVLQK